MDREDVALLIGVGESSIRRWVAQFNSTGTVYPERRRNQPPRYPEEVLDYIKNYVDEYPCFILEELQQAIQARYPDQANTSIPTVCIAISWNAIPLTQNSHSCFTNYSFVVVLELI